MTQEEIAKFALVLKECERLRARIAEEAALPSDGIPIVAAPAEERPHLPAMATAA